MDGSGYRSALSYQLVWLSGLVPFAQAQQIVEEGGQGPVRKTSIWEQTQAHGERLQRGLHREQQQVRVERTRCINATTQS